MRPSLLVACLVLGCDAPPSLTSPFRVAITGAPGGAFLGVWVPPSGATAYLCGGYVAVDPARVPPGAAGRLVRFENERFTTLCHTPRVLWWVYGVDGVVFAVGDGGTIIRYTPARGCEALEPGDLGSEGPPTFWGTLGPSATDLYVVGGSTTPTGPKGVLLHYDGARFERLTVPPSAREENLYKITHGGDRTYVVGAAGTVFSRADGATDWEMDALPVLGQDDALFTVSCTRDGALCGAVGGTGNGRALVGEALELLAAALAEDRPDATPACCAPGTTCR